MHARFSSLHAAALLSTLLAAAATAQTPSERSLLWRIEGNGLRSASYLYGTMHVQHKDAFNLGDSVLPALAACRWFATEVHLDSMARAYIERMLLHGDTLPERGGAEEEDDWGESSLIKGMFTEQRSEEDGESAAGSGRNPFKGLSDIVSRSRDPENDSPVFLDAWLFQMAKKMGKKLLGVEEISEHLDIDEVIGGSDEGDGSSSRMNILESLAFQRQMLDAYRAGDVAALEDLMRRNMPPHEFHRMLTRRNRIMVESIVTYVGKEATFIAVGAGHLGGEYGVIAMLRDRGYRVTAIPATRSGKPSTVVMPRKALHWKTLDDVGGAFMVDLPNDPVASRIDTVDGDEPQIRFWMTADVGGGLLYTIFTIDATSSFSLSRLSAMLDMVATRWSETFDGTTLSTSRLTLKGMVGRESIMKDDEGTGYRMRVYLRGARFYLLTISGDERLLRGEDGERFFGSFRTRPFAVHAWKKVVFNDDGVEVAFPGDPLDDSSQLSYPPNLSIRVARSRDINSGRTYSMQVYRYSEYYHAGKPETYWKQIIDDWAGPHHRVADSAITVQGFPGRDITLTDTATLVVTRIRSLVAGRRLIEIWGAQSGDREGSEQMNRFISSLRLTRTLVDGNIFASHAAEIVAGLASDSLRRRQRARSEAPSYRWSRNDLPLLYGAIDRNYPDDHRDSTPTREMLVLALSGPGDSTTVSFLRSLAIRSPDDAALKGAIATALAGIGTDESIGALIDLLRKESKPLKRFSFYAIGDSIAPRARLIPSLMEFAEVREYRLALLNMVERCFDSGYVSPDAFRGTILSRVCRASISEHVHPRSRADFEKDIPPANEQWTGVAARVLGWLEKDDENIRAVKELLPEKNGALMMSATIALVRLSGGAPKEALERCAADSSVVVWFYSELSGMKRVDLFPPFWRKQAHFAMGELIRWINNDYGREPSEVRYLAQREVDLPGGRGRVFLFKFRVANSPWLVGLGGPQPITSTDITIERSLSVSAYTELSSLSLDRHFAELLAR